MKLSCSWPIAKMLLSQYLNANNLKVINATADGHCLLHSLATSFYYQLGKTNDYHDIKCSLFKETLRNRSAYINFTSNQRNLTNLMKNYLLYKQYNSDYGDILPLVIANAFNIDLHILNENEDGTYDKIVINAWNSSTVSASIYLHRIKDHYNGIAIYHKFSLIQSRANVRTTTPSKCVQDLLEIQVI